MSDKSINGKWDPNIPIQFDRNNLEIVNIQSDQRLSLDGHQEVKYIQKNDQYTFQIFGTQDQKLIYEFSVAVFDFHYAIQEIFFTSEYLILIRKKKSFRNVDVYIHSFILQKGEHFNFKKAHLLKYFHSNQEFHLLIQPLEQKRLRLFKVDKQFQISLLHEMDITGLQILKQNNIGFFVCARERLYFLSKTLKQCYLIIQSKKDHFYYKKYFDVDFDKNLFYSNFQNGKYVFVAQIRNSKVIRKLVYKRSTYDEVSRCIYKNYLLSCFDGYCLIVHNLKTGEQLAKVKFNGYNKFYQMLIQNGYLIFRNWYNIGIGWKLQND